MFKLLKICCVVGAPARPASRAAEPAAAQPAPPRADRRPRLLVPALGVAPPGAAARALRAALRPPVTMRPTGITSPLYHTSLDVS